MMRQKNRSVDTPFDDYRGQAGEAPADEPKRGGALAMTAATAEVVAAK
jgi:hypothetical protein